MYNEGWMYTLIYFLKEEEEEEKKPDVFLKQKNRRHKMTKRIRLESQI
jgi:hypothetical protein